MDRIMKNDEDDNVMENVSSTKAATKTDELMKKHQINEADWNSPL